MGFIILLLISTIAVAGSAAFFSVYGLAQIFSASFVAVIIMGGSLEVGKLVAASYLYRFWTETPKVLKAYLFVAVFTLMAITSLGIFGFLTAAYQLDSIELKQQQGQIVLYEDQKIAYTSRLALINDEISKPDANYISKRMELIDKFEPEKKNILKNLAEIDSKLLELKGTVLQTEAKIGPIIYVAEVLDENPDKATFWFVILIIGVFDPLAVSLTLATNIAMRKRREAKVKELPTPTESRPVDDEEDITDHPIDVSPTPLKAPESSPTPTPTMEVDVSLAPSTDMSDEINAIKRLIMDSNKSEDITKLYESLDVLSKEFKKSRIRDELGNVHRN
jgi:hypothetical protein